jgi:hypothetical protein
VITALTSIYVGQGRFRFQPKAPEIVPCCTNCCTTHQRTASSPGILNSGSMCQSGATTCTLNT